MKCTLDCLPCFVSEGLNVARMATSDPRIQERIVRETLCRASQADLTQSPTLFGGSLRQWVREITGQADPYLAVKQESNRLALALLPAWRERLRTAANPRLTAVKMAIAGNVIDYGMNGDLTAETIPAELESSLTGLFHGDVAEFFATAERATEILFLADNAGELVFDRLLLEFADLFENKFVRQGYDEDRTIEDTLGVGWEILSTLPVEQLTRIDRDLINKYHPKFRTGAKKE